MCIDLYVDKLLVYSNCMTPSPSPMSHISTVPSPTNLTANTSPTPSNSTYDTDPIFTPLPDHTITIAIIMACAIFPCIIWMICACVKCRKKKKVQPEKHKKKCCEKKVQTQKKPCCSKAKPALPTRGTQTN